jgi:hypothetical protein
MRVFPSQVVQAIEDLIGRKSTDIDERRVTYVLLPEVNSILALLDDVPSALIDLPFPEYVELTRCRAILAAAAARWVLGDMMPARNVAGKDPVERIRRLMLQCQDELPPPEPELPFVRDALARANIEREMHTAWVNFSAQNWLGATTFAGAALEALLLWALESSNVGSSATKKKKAPNELYLSDLIEEAGNIKLISEPTAKIARQAKDARNLIHPGLAARSDTICTKASALTAPAGLYRVIEDLKSTCSST